MTTTISLPKKTDDNALLAELALLRADNERLKAENAKKANGPLSLKVSEKGAVSLIGMGRFPVTLYKQQWVKVADFMPQILAFIVANDAKLSQGKADKPVPAPVASEPDYATLYAELAALKAQAAKA